MIMTSYLRTGWMDARSLISRNVCDGFTNESWNHGTGFCVIRIFGEDIDLSAYVRP